MHPSIEIKARHETFWILLTPLPRRPWPDIHIGTPACAIRAYSRRALAATDLCHHHTLPQCNSNKPRGSNVCLCICFLALSSWVQALLISGLMTHNSQLTKWPDSQKLGKLNRRGRYPSSEAIWTAGMAPRSASGRPSFQLGSFICLKRWNLSVRLVHLLVKLCQSFWCHFEGHANIK